MVPWANFKLHDHLVRARLSVFLINNRGSCPDADVITTAFSPLFLLFVSLIFTSLSLSLALVLFFLQFPLLLMRYR